MFLHISEFRQIRPSVETLRMIPCKNKQTKVKKGRKHLEKKLILSFLLRGWIQQEIMRQLIFCRTEKVKRLRLKAPKVKKNGQKTRSYIKKNMSYDFVSAHV
jgi:hypothetical protein